MSRDLRVCFVGDSLVAGVGDPRCLGWVGRLAAQAYTDGIPVVAYNLGVRRQTSTDIRARFLAECVQRLPAGTDARIVLSFGVNDTMQVDGQCRVTSDQSVANLGALVRQAAEYGWPVLMVAPPPIDDVEHNARTAALDEQFTEICAAEGIPYVRIHHQLRKNAVWMREVREGDGAHPGAAGYDELAAAVAPQWREWLSR
ncbi:GDSL-type esterase/lipase family protein [Nocardia sp. CWNU-33]|uniref:DUF459 domain-containing protein n=1 Tax=Nocardia sp. CWNU-33 TaxID=3392117 RepID=UPI00398ED2B2